MTRTALCAWTCGLLVAVLLVTMLPTALAQEFEDEAEGEGEGGDGLGVAAAVALGAVAFTALVNLGRRRYLLPALKGNKEGLVKTMRLHRRVWLPIHLTTGVATVVLGILHGLAEEHGNWMLWTSMGAFGFLTAGGAILAWKWTPATVRKGVYLLHTQQLLFVATLALLWVGHAFGED